MLVGVAQSADAAGFCLAGLVIGLASLKGAQTHVQFYFFIIPSLTARLTNFGYLVNTLLNDLLYVNIFWGLVNLLPIYPLDGGQVARAVFERVDAVQGRRRSLWLSAGVAAGIVLLGVLTGSLYMILLFGVLAASSAQMAEALRAPSNRRPSAGLR